MSSTISEINFDKFWEREKPRLNSLLKVLQAEIEDSDRASDDPDDDIPAIAITISINSKMNCWNYQVGDNSFEGACYGDPYWGIGVLDRESDTNELANELIKSLEEVCFY